VAGMGAVVAVIAALLLTGARRTGGVGPANP